MNNLATLKELLEYLETLYDHHWNTLNHPRFMMIIEHFEMVSVTYFDISLTLVCHMLHLDKVSSVPTDRNLTFVLKVSIS